MFSQGSDGPEAAKKTARQELQVTQAALIRNPKSYGSWHYRKWITEQRLLPLEEELQLVQQYVTLSPCYKTLHSPAVLNWSRLCYTVHYTSGCTWNMLSCIAVHYMHRCQVSYLSAKAILHPEARMSPADSY